MIISGPRDDVLEYLKQYASYVVKYTTELEFYKEWNTNRVKPAIFLDPSFSPKNLKPNRGNIIVFSYKVIHESWIKWSKDNSINIKDISTSKDSLKSLLLKGSEKFNIPKFQEEAIDLFFNINSISRHNILTQIQYLNLIYPGKEFITEKDLSEVWNVAISSGKYTINLSKLLGLVGSLSAIKYVKDIPSSEAYLILKGLQSAYKNKKENLELVQFILEGIDNKEWRPKAGLILFLVYTAEAKCLSTSKTTTLYSTAIMKSFQQLDMS